MKKLFFACILLTSLSLFTADQQEEIHPLMLSNNLKDITLVKEQMGKEGFENITFQTPDNLKLHGYFRQRKNANATIIFSAGFHPGRKEGVTSFVPLLNEQRYNMLFFDARGHGDSGGRNYWHPISLWQYGTKEYQDVIGALQFLHAQGITDKIILHGICSGAFHNVTALHELTRSKNTEWKELGESVEGVVLDSPWNQISDIAQPVIEAGAKKHFKNNRCLSIATSALLKTVYTFGVKPAQWWYNRPLEAKLKKIPHPILWMHHRKDKIASFDQADKTITNLQKHRSRHSTEEVVKWTTSSRADHTTGRNKFTVHGNLHYVDHQGYVGALVRFIGRHTLVRSIGRNTSDTTNSK